MKVLFAALSLLLLSTQLNAQTNYNYQQIHRETLNRGLVVIPDGDSICLSWRFLSSDTLMKSTFNVYQNGKKLNDKIIEKSTFLKIPKNNIGGKNVFEVRTVQNNKEVDKLNSQFTLRNDSPNGYISIPLNRPNSGTTPDGRTYSYTANDASVGDVDGDGEYEIFLKWEPTNAHDNSHEGYTGNVLIDCYKLSGEQLWRIDLGHNIRAGSHYTQFMVYDLDGDNKSEIVMKTADATLDGCGTYIGEKTADYRYTGFISGGRRVVGRILDGPEYLTVFNGETGKAMHTIPYIPQRGKSEDWGDNYGNRCDRFLACIAYLDGVKPSVVMCRGYYTRTVLAAFDWTGSELKEKWVFDTNNSKWRKYAGQGNHNIRVADVDNDGCDEIVYGSMTVDHDGTGLYNTRLGHGDAIHLTPFMPTSNKLHVWAVHENKRDGSTLRDAATGEIVFQIPSRTDVGRGMATDIDPTNEGLEMWSLASGGIRNFRGDVIAENVRIPVNSAVWWDGDLLREMLDRGSISKYDWTTHQCHTIMDFNSEGCAFNNGSKNNPCLSADIIGDWREEVIVRSRDNSELRIYSTTIPTQHRLPSLMEDIPYRLGVATQNVSYNQPPHTGYYIGAETRTF